MTTFREELRSKLSMLEDLPTLPSIIHELERLLHSDSVSMQEIAIVIEEDPAIAASVLRVANSVVYFSSMSGRIVSLRDALVRLGVQEVQRLVSAAAIIQAFGKFGHHLDAGQFWHQSLRTAVCLRMIARSASGAYLDEDEAYMAGLLRDIGWLILDQYFPDIFDKVQAEIAAQPLPPHEVERAQLGMDHGEVGGCLFEEWNLPAGIIAAATWHNQPEQAGSDAMELANTVRLAELVTEALGNETEEQAESDSQEHLQNVYEQPLWKELGFDAGAIASVIKETRKWSTPVFALV